MILLDFSAIGTRDCETVKPVPFFINDFS